MFNINKYIKMGLQQLKTKIEGAVEDLTMH